MDKNAALEYPVTVDEWGTYIQTLTNDELYAKTASVNSALFFKEMKEDGIKNEDTEQIIKQFAFEIKIRGMLFPPDGFFDLGVLVRI
jgi:hypothetical protein